MAARDRTARVTTTLTTTEARRDLPNLARRAARRVKPGKSLTEHAVRIQPQGEERAAYLVAEVDLLEALDRMANLEELLEDVELVALLEQRLDSEERSSAQLLAQVMREFADQGLLSATDIASVESARAPRS